MKKSFAILFVLVAMAFAINSATADTHDCTSIQGPIYTETGTSIR